MENTFKLMHDIAIAEDHTAKIEKNVEDIDNKLKAIHSDLEISKLINVSLHTLDSSLKTASDLLTVISIIPQEPFNTEALNLKTKVDELRKPVSSAAKTSDDVEGIIKPIRESIENIEPKIEAIDLALLALMGVESSFIDVLGSATQCIQSLPDSDIKNDLNSKIDAASAEIDPYVTKFDQGQVIVLTGMEDLKNVLNKITAYIQKLNILNTILNKINVELFTLIKALNDISNAFSTTIRVPYGGYPKMCKKWHVWYPCGWVTVYYSFTIGQILNGLSGVIKPVMDLLTAGANAVLKPLLDALNLKIELPSIPELDVLDSIKTDFPDIFKSVEDEINSLLNNELFLTDFELKIKKFTLQISDINQSCLISISPKK